MKFNSNISSTNRTSLSLGSDKFLENKVRFSFKHTESNKNYCIKNCSRDDLYSLYKTLGEKENLTWHQIKSIGRAKGISLEKKGDSNHKLLEKINSNFNTFGHIRIKNRDSLGRIFGGLQDDLFYILLIDIEGNINH